MNILFLYLFSIISCTQVFVTKDSSGDCILYYCHYNRRNNESEVAVTLIEDNEQNTITNHFLQLIVKEDSKDKLATELIKYNEYRALGNSIKPVEINTKGPVFATKFCLNSSNKYYLQIHCLKYYDDLNPKVDNDIYEYTTHRISLNDWTSFYPNIEYDKYSELLNQWKKSELRSRWFFKIKNVPDFYDYYINKLNPSTDDDKNQSTDKLKYNEHCKKNIDLDTKSTISDDNSSTFSIQDWLIFGVVSVLISFFIYLYLRN